MTLVELEKIINDAIKESLKEEMEKKQPVIGMSTREAIEKQQKKADSRRSDALQKSD